MASPSPFNTGNYYGPGIGYRGANRGQGYPRPYQPRQERQQSQAAPKQEVTSNDPEIQRALNVAKAKKIPGVFEVARAKYNKAAAREGKQMDENGDIVGLDSTPTQTLYAKTPTGRYKPAGKAPLVEAEPPTQEELDAQRKDAIIGKYAKGQSISDDARLEAGLPDTPRQSSADIAAAKARKEQADLIAAQEAEQAVAREAALTSSKEKRAAEVGTHKAYANSLKTKLMLAQRELAPLEAAEKAAQTNLALPKPDKVAIAAARTRRDAILKQVDEADNKVLESSVAYQKHLEEAATAGAEIDVFKAGIKQRHAKSMQIGGITVNATPAGMSFDATTGRLSSNGGQASTEARPDPQQASIFRNATEAAVVDKNNSVDLPVANDPANIAGSKLMQQRMQLAQSEEDPNVRHYAQKDVEARIADPVKWEAAQYDTVQALSDEELAGKLQLMPQVIEQGKALLQQSQLEAQAEQEGFQQRLAQIEAANAKDQDKPFTMGDSKINTATGQRWHTAHLDNYENTVRQANEAQAKAAAAMQIDENEVGRDVSVHNARIIEAKRREDNAKAEQGKKREGVLRGLEAEGRHGLAGDLLLIDAEQKAKLEQINPFIERGSDEYKAAAAVIEEETQARIENAAKESSMLPAKAAELYKTWGRDANNNYVNWITNESPYDQGRNAADSESTKQGYIQDVQRRKDLLAIQAEKLGVNPKDLAYQLETQRILDWSKPLTEKADIQQNSLMHETAKKFGWINEIEPTRTLPNGAVTVNPAMGGDKAEFEAAIKTAPASKEGKEAARQMWPAYHQAWLEKARETLSGADTVPGVEGYNDWIHRNIESGFLNKPDGSLLSPTEQTEKYVEAMKGRGNFRKLLDNVSSSLLAGSHDIMTAVYGTGAIAAGVGEALTGKDDSQISELFSTVAADKSAQSERLMQAKGMEGTDTLFGSKLAGGAISQTARILPGMAPTMATGSMAGAMLAGAMQTGGMQYADTYRALIDQGYDHDQAWSKAAPNAVYSGVMTAVLTKAFPGGITALNNKANQAVLRQSVGEAIKSYASGSARAAQAIAKGALDEFPQETMDEFNSQMSQAMAEGKSPKQAVSSFIANLPELVLSTGIAGGLGGLGDMGGKSEAQPGVNPTAAPSGISPADSAAIATAIKNYTGGADATPEESARTRNLASAIVKLRGGAALAGLTQTELAATGYERKADKIVPIKDVPQAAYEQDGKVVITDNAIQEINDAIPATNILGLKPESERLDEINKPATDETSTGAPSSASAAASVGDTSGIPQTTGLAGNAVPAKPSPQSDRTGAGALKPTQGQGDAGSIPASAATIDTAAHEAATSPLNDKPQPTGAQKKAGNYPLGKLNLGGVSISIENPSGSTRDWTNEAGESGSSVINGHYGYIKGTVGHDGDQIDALVKEGTPSDWNGTVYVIKQLKADGKTFDEDKVYIGFESRAEAKAAYKSNYQKGWRGFGGAIPVMMKDLAQLVKGGKLRKSPSTKSNVRPTQQPATVSASNTTPAGVETGTTGGLLAGQGTTTGKPTDLASGSSIQEAIPSEPTAAVTPIEAQLNTFIDTLKSTKAKAEAIYLRNKLVATLKPYLATGIWKRVMVMQTQPGTAEADRAGIGMGVSIADRGTLIIHPQMLLHYALQAAQGQGRAKADKMIEAGPFHELAHTLDPNTDEQAAELWNLVDEKTQRGFAAGYFQSLPDAERAAAIDKWVTDRAMRAYAGREYFRAQIEKALLGEISEEVILNKNLAKALYEMIQRLAKAINDFANTLKDRKLAGEMQAKMNAAAARFFAALPPEVQDHIRTNAAKEGRKLPQQMAEPKKMTVEEARKKVAEFWRTNAKAVRSEDPYASHVTEEQKEQNLQNSLRYADEVESGKHDNNFTIAQRLHYEMTGEEVALLPKYDTPEAQSLPANGDNGRRYTIYLDQGNGKKHYIPNLETMTHGEALTFRSKQTNPAQWGLEEVAPPDTGAKESTSPKPTRPVVGKAPPQQRIAIAKGMAGGPAYAEFATPTDADAYRWHSNMKAAMSPGKKDSPKAKAAIASSLLARVAEATGMQPAELRTTLIAYNKAVREQAKGVAEGEAFHAPTLESFMRGGEQQMAAPKKQPLRMRITREALTTAALSQASWKDWYQEHQDTLQRFFKSDDGLFQKILAITSQAASVKANVGLALKAFVQMKEGKPFTGFLPAVIGNLNALVAETTVNGQKIGAYMSANEGNTGAVVVDRHIARMLFGVDTPSKAQFDKASNVLTKIAQEIGWTPRQVQAALWAASIVKSGKTPQSYGSYIQQLHSKGTLRERIGSVVDSRSEVHGTSRAGGDNPRGSEEAPARVASKQATPVATASEATSNEGGGINGPRPAGGSIQAVDTPTLTNNGGMSRQNMGAPKATEPLPSPKEQIAAVRRQYEGKPTWRKAPNGKDSNLTEDQWLIVRTPNFKRWFGDWEAFASQQGGVWNDDSGKVSKVVDENGEPRVVYHGSQKAGFNTFDMNETAHGHRPASAWFSSQRDVARTYSGTRELADINQDEEGEYDRNRGNYAVFLNIRNPYEEYFDGANWDGTRPENEFSVWDSEEQIYVDESDTKKMTKEEAEALYESLGGDEAQYKGRTRYDVQNRPSLHTSTNGVAYEAKDNGSDGAYIHDVVDDGGQFTTYDTSDVYVAFEPNQIKDANSNSGAFSAKDNNILFMAAPKASYRSPTDMLATTRAQMQGGAGEKPAGLSSMFNPKAGRPATGERTLFETPKKADELMTVDEFAAANPGMSASDLRYDHMMSLQEAMREDKPINAQAANALLMPPLPAGYKRNGDVYSKTQNEPDIRAAYASAASGKSSAYITLDELYDALKAKEPDITERQMAEMLRKMDENGEASLEISEDSATTLRNREKYGLMMGTVPASGVAIHPRITHTMPDGYQLTEQGMQMMPKPAHHGTPHKVDRFSISRIGTGEGNQAYGWGLYFAGNKKVAEEYQTKLAKDSNGPPRRFFLGDPLVPGTPEYHAATLLSRTDKTRTLASAKKEVTGWIVEAADDARMENSIAGWRKTLEILNRATKKSDFTEKPPEGNLYTVEILPEEEEFLDWDKPLSEQPDKVKAIFRKWLEANKWGDYLKAIDAYDAGGGSKALKDNGRLGSYFGAAGSIYQYIASEHGGEKGLSLKLAQAGIPGIRYLDGGSRGAGEGTHNYVIFDDKLVRILEENGRPVGDSQPREAQQMAAPWNPAKYTRVIPRDFFNEGKALTLVGRLASMQAKGELPESFKLSGSINGAALDESGDMLVNGIRATYDGDPVQLTMPYNAGKESRLLLYFTYEAGDVWGEPVFNAEGGLSEEFRAAFPDTGSKDSGFTEDLINQGRFLTQMGGVGLWHVDRRLADGYEMDIEPPENGFRLKASAGKISSQGLKASFNGKPVKYFTLAKPGVLMFTYDGKTQPVYEPGTREPSAQFKDLFWFKQNEQGDALPSMPDTQGMSAPMPQREAFYSKLAQGSPMGLSDAISAVEAFYADPSEPTNWPEDLQEDFEKTPLSQAVENADFVAFYEALPENKRTKEFTQWHDEAKANAAVNARLEGFYRNLKKNPQAVFTADEWAALQADPNEAKREVMTQNRVMERATQQLTIPERKIYDDDLENLNEFWESDKPQEMAIAAFLPQVKERVQSTIQQIEALGRHKWDKTAQTFDELDEPQVNFMAAPSQQAQANIDAATYDFARPEPPSDPAHIRNARYINKRGLQSNPQLPLTSAFYATNSLRAKMGQTIRSFENDWAGFFDFINDQLPAEKRKAGLRKIVQKFGMGDSPESKALWKAYAAMPIDQVLPADSERVKEAKDLLPYLEQIETQMMGAPKSQVTPEQDAEYMAAVESGDVAKQQAMVDAAAKAAGYTPKEVFHGSLNAFHTFDQSKSRNALGFHFAQAMDQVIGPQSRFSNTDPSKVKVIKAYLKASAPLELFDRGSWDGENTIKEINEKTGLSINAGTSQAGIASAIKSAGYDSVEYENQHEGEEGGRATIVFNPSQIKSADPITRDAEGNVIPLSQRFNDQSNDIRYMSAPKDQGDIDSRVLKRLADQLPEDDYLDQLDTAHSESFPEGSEGDWLRALQKENTTPDTVKAWDRAARRMIAKDPQAVIDEIVNNFYEGKSFGSPELALAGSILSADVLKQSQLSGDEAMLRKARAFSYAVGAGETQAGRELRALNNPHKSNRERVAEVIANLFTTPPPAIRAKIANAPSPSAKLKKIAELQARIKELEKQIVAGDKAAQKRAAEAQKELAATLRQQDKAQLVDEALAKREKKVKEALANEGLTVEDVLLTPEDRLAAQDSEIVERARAKHAAGQQKALLWIGRGFSDTDVAKFSGMERGAVATLREDYRNNSLKPEIAKELKKGRSIIEVIKDSFKKAFGIQMAAPMPWSNVQRVQPTPPKPPANKAKPLPKVEDTVAAEIDRMLDILAPNARAANGNSLLAAVVKGKNGTRVTIHVPFDADDFKNVYRVARAISISEASGFDKVYEYWINNLLSGPQTNVVNIIGNTLSVGINYLLQRPLETAINVLTRDAQSAQLGEWEYIAKGVVAGMGEAWQNAALAYSVEADPTAHRYLNEPVNIGFTPTGDVAKMGGYRGPSVKGLKGRVIRIPGRLLRMMDAMFKTFILHAEVGAMAYRLGKIEQKAGRIGATGADLQAFIQTQIDTKGSKSWMQAMRTATDLTFQDENWLTDIAKHITQGADKTVDKRRADAVKANAEGDTALAHSMELRANIMYAVSKLMSIIFPFVRTPSNILRMGVRKSPLGSLLLPLHFIQMIRLGVTNKIKGKDFLDSYPKGVLIKLLAEQSLAWMVTMGLLSSIEGDDDDDKKRFLIVGGRPWKDAGAKDAAYRDYGGTYLLIFRNAKGEETRIPFGRYEPVATLLGTTADAVRRFKERANRQRNGEPGANMEDAVKALMGDFVNQAQDKSFLQGIGGVMKEIDSLENSGDLTKGIKETAWKSILTAIVPNIIRQPMRNIDDKQRDSKKKNDWYDAFPMGSNAEPVIDLLGNEAEKGGDPFTRIFFPVANKQQQVHPITPLIHQWNSTHNGEKIEPAPMNRSGFYIYNTDGKTKIPLVTPQEKSAFQRIIGSNLRESAANVADNIKANGGELPDNFDDVVQKIITAARKDARQTALNSSPFLAAKQKQP